MSLGGGVSWALDDAVRRSIGKGFAYAVAAGNSGINACNASPARVGAAMTVAASDSYDRKPSWSNYGSCVDWFGPGVSITSAWHTSDTAINTIDGTSMATPHAAGVVALIWSVNPALSNSTVEDHLFRTARDLGAAGYDTTYGYGLVDAAAAVARAGG